MSWYQQIVRVNEPDTLEWISQTVPEDKVTKGNSLGQTLASLRRIDQAEKFDQTTTAVPFIIK